LTSPPPLAEVLSRLRRRGLGIGVRDHLEALGALRAGFGVGSREDLRWLCESLWARGEDEVRLVRREFDAIEIPPEETIARLVGERTTASRDDAHEEGRGRARRAGQAGDQNGAASMPDAIPVEFAAAGETGLGVPPARVRSGGGEPLVLHDRPPVAERTMALLWRRFRRPRRARSGVRAEPDVTATVVAKCRDGFVVDYVRRPGRRNTARLVLLVDTSDEMLPWRGFADSLVASLVSGRMEQAHIAWFATVPTRLYSDQAMAHPLGLAEALEAFGEGSLMVLSDGGAVRPERGGTRIRTLRRFLDQIRGCWHPVTWVNPMPPRRWPGTPAECIARLSGIEMVDLSETGLTRAVDVLRGGV
jgi:uncharacterized protein